MARALRLLRGPCLIAASGLPANADKQDLIIQGADALLAHGADLNAVPPKPWKPLKEYVNVKNRNGYICSEPLRAWMEKHLWFGIWDM